LSVKKPLSARPPAKKCAFDARTPRPSARLETPKRSEQHHHPRCSTRGLVVACAIPHGTSWRMGRRRPRPRPRPRGVLVAQEDDAQAEGRVGAVRAAGAVRGAHERRVRVASREAAAEAHGLTASLWRDQPVGPARSRTRSGRGRGGWQVVDCGGSAGEAAERAWSVGTGLRGWPTRPRRCARALSPRAACPSRRGSTRRA
jgi:hypothetical protein